MQENFQETRNDVKDLIIEKRRAQIDRWLSPSDPSANLKKAIKQHQETQVCGFWRWTNLAVEDISEIYLWLHGKPGCRNTTLSLLLSIISSTFLNSLYSISSSTSLILASRLLRTCFGLSSVNYIGNARMLESQAINSIPPATRDVLSEAASRSVSSFYK